MEEPDPRRWRVLAVVCAALSVVVIDTTVLHVAAPVISRELDASPVELLWIVDVYALVVAPLLVGFAKLADKVGRRRILLTGLSLFGAASLVAAFAPTAGALIAGRALMGVGGAMILPQTMSIVRDVFPDRAERTRAVGIWTATTSVGGAGGPVIGGFLVEHLWWGSVFLINLPLIAIILVLAMRWVPATRAERPAPLDPVSVLPVTVAVLGLAFGVKQGGKEGFDDLLALAALAGGAGLLTTFVRRQLRAEVPLLDVRLFARTDFRVAVGCIVLAMMALVGLDLFFAQYLQLVLGLGPVAASIRLLPLAVAALIGGLAAARVLARVGTRASITASLFVCAAALAPLLALSEADEPLLLTASLFALGVAVQLLIVAANDVILASVDADRAGDAASIEETAYELGGGMGIAVLGSIFAAVSGGTLTGFLDGLHAIVAVAVGLMLLATAVAAVALQPRAALSGAR